MPQTLFARFPYLVHHSLLFVSHVHFILSFSALIKKLSLNFKVKFLNFFITKINLSAFFIFHIGFILFHEVNLFFVIFRRSENFMWRFQSLWYYTESCFMARFLRQHLHVISHYAWLIFLLPAPYRNIHIQAKKAIW